MEQLLMHKDIIVMKFSLGEDGDIRNIIEVYNADHMPFSTGGSTNNNLFALKEWWKDRSIPVTRDEYNHAINNLPEDNSLSLVVKTRALSLTDQYWIKGVDENIRYDDVSFFSNNYSNDIGDIFIGKKRKGAISYYSPDSTSTGNLKKRWKTINGKRYLFKAGTKPYQYEIFNEIIASKIMNILDVDHVDYELAYDEEMMFCKCLDFISYNEDFVSAYQLSKYRTKRNDVSLYDHLLSIMKELHIPDYQKRIDQMLFIDFLIGNVDRHLNNFGVIRDAKTLEFTRFSPLFDSGSSLGYNLFDKDLLKLKEVDWMPFKSQKHRNQLSLIKDYSWVNNNALETIPQQVDQLLKGYGDYVSKERRKAIVAFLINRINEYFSYQHIDKKVSLHSVDLSTLEEDILFYAYCHGNKLTDFTELMKEFGIAYITIYRAVSSLTSKGLLQRVGSRKTGYWILL